MMPRFNANLFAVALLLGALLGAGICRLVTNPAPFDEAPPERWKGSAPKAFPTPKGDPFASVESTKAYADQLIRIQDALDFVSFHQDLPGRAVILSGLAAYREMAQHSADVADEQFRNSSEEHEKFLRSTPGILAHLNRRLLSEWRADPAKDTEEFLRFNVASVLNELVHQSTNLGYWKAAGAPVIP